MYINTKYLWMWNVDIRLCHHLRVLLHIFIICWLHTILKWKNKAIMFCSNKQLITPALSATLYKTCYRTHIVTFLSFTLNISSALQPLICWNSTYFIKTSHYECSAFWKNKLYNFACLTVQDCSSKLCVSNEAPCSLGIHFCSRKIQRSRR